MAKDKTIQDVLESMDEDQLKVLSYLVAKAAAGDDDDDEVEHDSMDEDDEELDGPTIEEVLDTMDDDQLAVLEYLVDQAAEDALEHDDMDEDDYDAHDEIDDEYDDEYDDYDEEPSLLEMLDSMDDEELENALDSMDDDELEAVSMLLEDEADELVEHYDFGGNDMNFNAFDSAAYEEDDGFLSHSDEMDIIANAKQMGKLSDALRYYAEENELAHDGTTSDLASVSGFTSYPSGATPAGVDALFPEYHDVYPGAPQLVTNDQAWVRAVLNKVHKSPFSRIRTSSVDVRGIEEIRARGYAKGKEKILAGNYAVAKRATDPQTVYVRSALNHDDVVDITDFDYVDYQYKIDRMQLELELARAILIGDGRDAAAADKISPEHIRPIWTDADLYTIRKTLTLGNDNGTSTAANFGDNYRYAQAMEEALLDAKVDYKGTGTPDMFCTQQFFNKLMLAKDLNGRRLYADKTELSTALDVGTVYNVPEFANKTRTVGEGTSAKTYRLLAIIGNLSDYALGQTKGGEIIHRTQFDIDFNQEKSLLETRVSGATTRIYSFIVIEEEVTA